MHIHAHSIRHKQEISRQAIAIEARDQTNHQEEPCYGCLARNKSHGRWLKFIIELNGTVTHNHDLEQPTNEEAEPNFIDGEARTDEHANW
jgi:hypothetical protein